MIRCRAGFPGRCLSDQAGHPHIGIGLHLGHRPADKGTADRGSPSPRSVGQSADRGGGRRGLAPRSATKRAPPQRSPGCATPDLVAGTFFLSSPLPRRLCRPLPGRSRLRYRSRRRPGPAPSPSRQRALPIAFCQAREASASSPIAAAAAAAWAAAAALQAGPKIVAHASPAPATYWSRRPRFVAGTFPPLFLPVKQPVQEAVSTY